MQIFPAIDLSGGQVVRLYQGDYDQMTVYGKDPCAVAREFLDAGCLHVVDLDGARDGTLANFESIAAIARQGGLFIEVGGGIRTEDRIRGVPGPGGEPLYPRHRGRQGLCLHCSDGGKVRRKNCRGVDARDGYVAINGWKELSPEKGVDFCRRLYDAGVGTIIYTDISRDGAEQGTNLSVYRELAGIAGLRVTASGGISSLDELRELQRIGTHAAILGKALYTGRLDLKAVLEEVGVC